MIAFILKRLLHAVPLLVGIATATFFMAHLAPGDPMDMYLEERRQREVDPAVIELMRKRYGLDQPLHVQYGKWLQNVVRGDFGESFRYRRPVADLLKERIPYTLQLTVLALVLELLLGMTLGIISAVKQYSPTDKTITLTSLIVDAIPGFWLALMLVLVFSVELQWFPTSQTRSFDYDLLPFWAQLGDRLWHIALPLFVLTVGAAASTARYMRNKLLDVLSEDYVLAARARGLSEASVILRHALRNALIPIITKFGLSLPFLLGGAVLIERVFAWPGIGLLAAEAVTARDYPIILATTTIAAMLVVAGNLLADVTYALVDPRVSYGGQRKA